MEPTATVRSQADLSLSLQSALQKAREDIDHIQHNTVDAKQAATQAANLRGELERANSSFQTEHVSSAPRTPIEPEY